MQRLAAFIDEAIRRAEGECRPPYRHHPPPAPNHQPPAPNHVARPGAAGEDKDDWGAGSEQGGGGALPVVDIGSGQVGPVPAPPRPNL